MSRLRILCLALLSLLGACGPIHSTQYSLTPPATPEGRQCVSQCQQNRGYCRQSCHLAQQACLNEARSRAIDEYRDYVHRQVSKKKPVQRSVSDFEHSYGCNSNSCEARCESDYRDCFGGVCGGQVVARTVCTAFCDESKPGTPAPLTAAPAATSGATPGDDGSLCRKGMRVEVEWKGEWYPATVKGPAHPDGLCPVHYDEYGSDDDEAVSLRRLRPR